MSDDKTRRPRFSVGGPVVRAKVTFEPVVPLDGPVTDGPLIHVRGPLRRGKLTFAPVAAASVHLTVPLAAGADGDALFGKLSAVVAKVNELEALFDGAGLWVDGARSGVRDGAVVIVLTPNDPADAVETCRRVADHLFAAARKGGGVTVRVYAADNPREAVYELAA